MSTDVITQEVIRARLDGIVREMQAAVLRTGFSTIIRESHDFSAGITDREGNVIGQYSPLPPHLGAYPDCVQGVLEFYSPADMQDGDCFLANHPYHSGCPHPNDMVVVLPVFHEGEIIAFCASMGHKADIGGQSPGSRNTIARDVFGDGLQIMPVLFQRGGAMVKEVAQFLRANSRTPELVIGDLAAQAGALRSIGAGRLKALASEYGGDTLTTAFGDMIQRIEGRVRSRFAEWADGVSEAEALVDDIVDPTQTIRLHVAAIKQGDRLMLDFSGSGDQSLGPINVRPPFTRGMAYFAAIAMMDPTVPNNGGLARAIKCRFREGSILDPRFPGPVGFYSTTMAAVEDIVFEAMSRAAGKPAVVLSAFEQLGLRTEARVRQVFEQWQDGVYEAEAFTDDIVDPARKLRLHVAAIKEGDRLTLDFSGTDEQSLGPINVRPPFIRGMAYYATIAMIDPGIPNNFGLARAVECRFRDGTVVNPAFPTPIGFYSMTLSTVEDIVFEALSKAAGRPAVAHNASSGMVVMGAVGGGRRYVQYELMMSGNGAFRGGDGWTGTGHSWAGGSKLTSVEILESEFDVELQGFSLITDSGGPGEYRGGLGMRREYVVKQPSRYAGGSPRNIAPAHGIEGGLDGIAGAVTVNPGSPDERRYVGLISNVMLEAGDVVLVETGSAGGAGDPKERDRRRIVSDLRNGYITTDAAVQVYGLGEEAVSEALALPAE